jgi:hypothetical protein
MGSLSDYDIQAMAQEKIGRPNQEVAGRVDDGPGNIRLKSPPVIRTTLARPAAPVSPAEPAAF